MSVRMKRILLICIIATMIAIIIFVTFVMRAKCASDKKSIEYEVDQLSQEIVRHEYEEIRFQKEENQIILIDKDGNETIIPINQLLSKQIVQVYNKNNMVFYVLDAAQDDEYGLVFTIESFMDMNGIWSIERVGRNLYYYKTYR